MTESNIPRFRKYKSVSLCNNLDNILLTVKMTPNHVSSLLSQLVIAITALKMGSEQDRYFFYFFFLHISMTVHVQKHIMCTHNYPICLSVVSGLEALQQPITQSVVVNIWEYYTLESCCVQKINVS